MKDKIGEHVAYTKTKNEYRILVRQRTGKSLGRTLLKRNFKKQGMRVPTELNWLGTGSPERDNDSGSSIVDWAFVYQLNYIIGFSRWITLYAVNVKLLLYTKIRIISLYKHTDAHSTLTHVDRSGGVTPKHRPLLK
jgi:hypothetical protein